MIYVGQRSGHILIRTTPKLMSTQIKHNFLLTSHEAKDNIIMYVRRIDRHTYYIGKPKELWMRIHVHTNFFFFYRDISESTVVLSK